MNITLESKFWKAPLARQALEAAAMALNSTWGTTNLWKVDEAQGALVAGPVRLGVSVNAPAELVDAPAETEVMHTGPTDAYVMVVYDGENAWRVLGVSTDPPFVAWAFEPDNVVPLQTYRRLACPALTDAERKAIADHYEARTKAAEAALQDEQVARRAEVLELQATVEGLKEQVRSARMQAAGRAKG